MYSIRKMESCVISDNMPESTIPVVYSYNVDCSVKFAIGMRHCVLLYIYIHSKRLQQVHWGAVVCARHAIKTVQEPCSVSAMWEPTMHEGLVQYVAH